MRVLLLGPYPPPHGWRSDQSRGHPPSSPPAANRERRNQLNPLPQTRHAAHILLCGDVLHALTLQAIARSDLMLRTTLYNGQALYLGTPVIATNNGMRPEGVRLIPPANASALRSAIAEALAAPRPARRPETGPDERNLEAVLDLYGEVMAN